MTFGPSPRPRPSDWAVWALSSGLRAFVVGLALTAAVAIGCGLVATPVRGGDLLTFGLLIGAGAAAVESRRRLSEPAGGQLHDLLSAWWLPTAVLLPPVYALLSPVALLALSQWRVRALVIHRRIFSAAAIGLAYGGSSVAFHALTGATGTTADGPSELAWWLLVAGCGLLATFGNAVLVSTAVKLANPQTSWPELLWGRERTWLDLVDLSAGLVVTLAASRSGLLVFAILPVLVMLQRSFLHSQLSAAARVDGKTGLLNAVTWESEAEAELLRLHRTRQPAAALLIDIDMFKAVNDTYGHLVGDQVLVAVAGALSGELREGDLLGRFGGEEFAVLLPTADDAEARLAAERVRSRVADLCVPAANIGDVRVTISVGVAVSDAPGLMVADLLAAADAELYRAKAAGRNRVRVAQDAGRFT